MGIRGSKHHQQQQQYSSASGSDQQTDLPVIPSDLIKFLNTATGATWLADVLLGKQPCTQHIHARLMYITADGCSSTALMRSC